MIRDGAAGDAHALEALYAAAFPGEELRPLVRALLAEPADVISLVATADDAVAGHVALTLCGVAGGAGRAALVGPLAVAPGRQRRGIGGALLRAGLARAADAGAALALVLGDPAYYGRFGFAPERGVTPPYPLPDAWREAWASLPLRDGPSAEGTLLVPAPWRDPALWGA